MTTPTPPCRRRRRSSWPALFVALSVVPLAAGGVRLNQLVGGAPVTPSNARFFAAPTPVVLHIVAAFGFALVGAFQFAPGLRRRRSGWHRVAGRFTVVAGLVVALSGLWMTLFYARPPGDGDLLTAMRLGFGTAMAFSLVAGLVAVLRRDLTGHRAWMVRGYAIGMGAGTQVLTNLPWVLLVGAPSESTRAVLMGAGWVINLVVAEVVIRRTGRIGQPRSGTTAPVPDADSIDQPPQARALTVSSTNSPTQNSPGTWVSRPS